MVAPFVIAGLGAILGGVANAILGKGGTTYAVVRIGHGEVVGKVFTDIDKAEAWQEEISKHGQSSIIVQRVTVKGQRGTYTSLHPVQGMAPAPMRGTLGQAFTFGPPGYWLVKWRAPGSTKEHLEIFEWEREAKERERNLNQMQAMVSISMIPHTKRTARHPKKIHPKHVAVTAVTPAVKAPAAPTAMSSFKPPYDTKEAQENATLLTTRHPVPERFDRARKGPFPETADYEEQKLTSVPEFDDTTSSHMWKTSVVTKDEPLTDAFGNPYDRSNNQPDTLVVEQALQDPGTQQ